LEHIVLKSQLYSGVCTNVDWLYTVQHVLRCLQLVVQYITDWGVHLLLSNVCQESLKKFREEAEKLEKSESLQKAREKYVRVLAVLQQSYADLFAASFIYIDAKLCLLVYFLPCESSTLL